jgi:hypothetical protein
VLGLGERASHVVEILNVRRDAGMQVVGWTGNTPNKVNIDDQAHDLRLLCRPRPDIDRVIVAMEDRRGSMPIRELLDLRLRGVVIEDAVTLMERLLGRLPLEALSPRAFLI